MPGKQIVKLSVQRLQRHPLHIVITTITLHIGLHAPSPRRQQLKSCYKYCQSFYKSAHTTCSLNGVIFAGAHPRAYQANKPEHLALTLHWSQSFAYTCFQSEMLRWANCQRFSGSAHSGAFMNKCRMPYRCSVLDDALSTPPHSARSTSHNSRLANANPIGSQPISATSRTNGRLRPINPHKFSRCSRTGLTRTIRS